jgi:HSP20 family protein
MNTDLKKWNPFKFLRSSGHKPAGNSPTQSPSDGDPSRAGWSDLTRLFSRDPWRGMEDLLNDPFAARGALDRWFGASAHRVFSRASTWSTREKYCV